MPRHVTVITPCYNEAGNVEPLRERIRAVFDGLPGYRHTHLFIDNASSDDTVARIKAMAQMDPDIRLIVNQRNFGHIRSPYHAFLQAEGDAVIVMVSDLQDPPELIPEFLALWEAGAPVVLGVKTSSSESWLMYRLRTLYYDTLQRLAGVKLLQHATGFGCYDRRVVEELRKLPDALPYVRGLIAELGFPIKTIPFHQAPRPWGFTKNNFYTLYDLAMLGFTTHSRVPLRLAIFTGFLVAGFSFCVALVYLVAKLILWNNFPNIGQAPTVVGLFFLGGVQLIFTGILGEYIGAIHTQVLRRPFVVEKERVGFPVDDAREARVLPVTERVT
ncbi:MAG: glycosyltransferase family 2 protein [Candidatus Sericytochromatia bacterium]|nr:glycosyltransferase family 2 protein [Candidatus Sericytochromatia bacterium]